MKSSAFLRLVRILLACSSVVALLRAAESPARYVDPTWKPRAILPAADALRGDFWPASPAVNVDYTAPGFADDRLAPVPEPGVHPRVLIMPSELEQIRAKVALGDKAPTAFRVMWQRTVKSRSAFYALVAQDDVLGRQLAANLVADIHSLEPKLAKLESRPDHDNLWSVERSLVASGDPDPPTEIWHLLDYDYLYHWMSPEDRELARRVIARLCANRITNFMVMPDHYMINNHEGFGMEYLRLMLLIEGEKGFDQKIFDLGVHKARAMLDWYLDGDGMCYESIKGWLNTSAFVAVGHRQRDFLKHGHLLAKMRFFQAAIHWEKGEWHIRDEMRASAFHVIWMMHYFYPQNEGIDFLYQSTFSTHDFLTSADAKWPNPVGVSPELLLLYADAGMTGASGKTTDWTDQANIDRLKLPLTWQDNTRGYVYARNSSRKDDLQLGFTCKQDFFYGGHEGSEANRLILWADGVNWIHDTDMLAVKATSLQNMLTVDGRGLSWPPAPGVWLGVKESPAGLVAAGDAKIAYSYAKVMQVHPLDFPSTKLPYYAPFAEGNFDLTRDQQVAFHPGTVAWTDGYAHTDYGPWSSETRLVENYRVNNPVAQAYRTVHLARGPQPYVLVLDDARKADDQPHTFEFNLTLPDDVVLVDAKNAEVAFQNVEPAAGRESDLLFARPGTPNDPQTGRPLVKKGDPLLLVRVLWRNTDYGYPVPSLRQFNGRPERPFQRFSQLVIPAISRSPEFRVLVYPYRQGDPLPQTSWNRDRTELTVNITGQSDVYRFGQTDGGRTVFGLTRNGQPALSSDAPPARPVIIVRGRAFDANDLRTTRAEGRVPEYLVGEETTVAFTRPAPLALIRYTTDGSDPVETSVVYEAPFTLKTSAVVTARVFDPRWPAGPQKSEQLVARFIARPASVSLAKPPASTRPGLLARVYEKKTVMWNDRGFFDAAKVMFPDLDRETPIHASVAAGFSLPAAAPVHPQAEQAKGFYRFTGWFEAPATGLYAFAVDSCGPVSLDVGGRSAIAEIGVFHQQQSLRRGEVFLAKGWHALDLAVCDPLFWNLNSADPMPFAVTVARDGGEASLVSDSSLRYLPPADLALAAAPAPVWHEAARDLPRLEPGVELSLYDCSGLRRSPDYLDIDPQSPLRRSPASVIEPNISASLVRVYEGYFRAPADGVYTFDLPRRRTASAGLGELSASYQNQLRIDGEVVVQRGVPGRYPLRKIGLKAGWHALSIRLGPSQAPGEVTYPDGQTLALTADLLARPVRVIALPEGTAAARNAYELYAPTNVSLALPVNDASAEIRYTLDGSAPNASSPRYDTPFSITADTVCTATAFVSGRAVTAPSSTRFQRVTIPQADLLAAVSFTQNDGSPAVVFSGPAGGAAWLGKIVAPAAGRKGPALAVNAVVGDKSAATPSVDANLSRSVGQFGFKLSGLTMRDNALSVVVWFKSDTATGKLFGKDGYTAFGKSYKTVSCSLDGGRLRAGPGRVTGGKVAAGEWQCVALTADENALLLYLNGERVADGPGSATLGTDALDFFTDHAAVVEGVRIYNRVLDVTDIRQLAKAAP